MAPEVGHGARLRAGGSSGRPRPYALDAVADRSGALGPTGSGWFAGTRETPRMTDVDMQLLEEAVGWTRAAGELTLGWFNHAELTVDSKGDGTPVTQADRASERMLREMIAAAYPED